MLALVYYLLEALKWLILIRAVLSWFVSPHSRNPAVELVRRLTDPILAPLARILPQSGAGDMSPIVAFFAIFLLQKLIMGIS